jgi:hypothetical protein
MTDTGAIASNRPAPADPAPPPAAMPGARFSWGDYFAFRTMITPTLIRIIYLIGVVVITAVAILLVLGTPTTTCVIDSTGTSSCTSTGGGPIAAVLIGIVAFILGQLYWRVITELLFVIFGIHESVRTIERRGQP